MSGYYYPACLRKTRHKNWLKVLLFFFVFCLDCLDLISDWLFYRDVVTIEKGLVFGPPEKRIVNCLLAFSIIGSVTFLFEVFNHGFDIFRDNPCIDTDVCSAIIVWIEDVPQIILSVIISACHEGAISYFQLVKASVLILGCIIRVIVALITCCYKTRRKAVQNDVNACLQSKRLQIVCRVLLIAGLIIIFSGSIVVFVFTQSRRNLDGSTNFRVPHTILREEYDNEKYLRNVNIYFSHPLFDYNTTGSIDADSANWIRLMTVFDVQKEHSDGLLKLQYDAATKSKLVIWQSDYNGNMTVTDCYTFNRSQQILAIDSSCDSLSTTLSEIIFTFHYIEPYTPGLVFGDISYNVKVKESGECYDANTTTESNIQKLSTDAVVRYYRNKDSISEDKHVVHTSTTEARFYTNQDLIDIEMVWKTGFAYCTSTGNLSPRLDTSINVPC